MHTENPPGKKAASPNGASAGTESVPSPAIPPDVASEVDREFDRYRSMRAEVRQQSGAWRRGILQPMS